MASISFEKKTNRPWPRFLAFAGLVAWSAAAADPGPPPAAGTQCGQERREDASGRRHRSASEVVGDFYDKLGQGDVPGLLDDFAGNAEWVLYGPSGIPFAGVHRGRDGIRTFIESFGRNAAVTLFEPKEFLSDKRKVVVQGYEEATATPTGKTWKAHWTHSFTVERGEIVLVEEVLDTAPVLAAFQP